jgi:FdhD protein
MKSKQEIMKSDTTKVPLSIITSGSRERTADLVAREFHVSISLNGREMITLPCSPNDLDCLAVGYLAAEGYIGSRDNIKKVRADTASGGVNVETVDGETAAAEGTRTKIESGLRISADEVFSLMNRFVRMSDTFKATGGVHAAALCNRQEIIVFKEDIGRNNAIDKLFGECILKGIPFEERVIALSCRMSSEILYKIARRKIPVIMSKSPPTDLGVKLADEMNITLLGFVRGQKMNAYTHDWRITDDGK